MPSSCHLYDAIERFTATAEFLVIGTGGEDKKNAAENWPAELCGCLLGRVVSNIRSLLAHSEYVECDAEELKKLGFSMNDADQKWHEVVLLALQAYHRIHGHCNISQRFVVPEEEPWPQELWGMLLGFTAGNIRTKGSYFNQRLQDYEKLEEIGFVRDAFKAKWKDRFLPALEKYVHVYGDANVPAGFVGKSVAAGDAWTTAGGVRRE